MVVGIPAAAQLRARFGLDVILLPALVPPGWSQGSAMVAKVCDCEAYRLLRFGARTERDRLARKRRSLTGAQMTPAFHAQTEPVLPP